MIMGFLRGNRVNSYNEASLAQNEAPAGVFQNAQNRASLNQFKAQNFNKLSESPSKQASYLGEQIRLSHQQMRQINQHSQLAQDAKEKMESEPNIFQKSSNQQHQNSNSMAAEFSHMMSNSFDRQNLKMQLNLDQKNRSKSSTRIKNSSISNNSNVDSGSYQIVNNQFQEIHSPQNNNENVKLVQPGELHGHGINKSNSLNVASLQQQTQPASMHNSNLFGHIISKQQIKYHKNASTNRGENEQQKFQSLLKINQIQQMQMHKTNSNPSNQLLRSPHAVHHAQPLNLIMSAQSKNSGNAHGISQL